MNLFSTISWLGDDTPFPPLTDALTAESGMEGLLALGGDLSASRLLSAYAQGVFPWYSEGQPICWFSPDPRMVLFVDTFHCSHNLSKQMRQFERDRNIRFSFDEAFEDVMRACAAPRGLQKGTWITEAMVQAYLRLHHLGCAHSLEVWHANQLIAGLYGVAMGRMFFGESMFTRVPNASKVALAQLIRFLKKHQVEMIDCQQQTAHLASLGAKAIPRADFLKAVTIAVSQPSIAVWHLAS